MGEMEVVIEVSVQLGKRGGTGHKREAEGARSGVALGYVGKTATC
jgi:hypothetical protein